MKYARTPWLWKSALLLLACVVLYALAIPNLSIYRRERLPKYECISNLKQIDGAIQQWALDNKRAETTAPDLPAAMKYLKDGKLPKCPSGGTYAAGQTVADAPTCSKGKELGHSLP